MIVGKIRHQSRNAVGALPMSAACRAMFANTLSCEPRCAGHGSS